MAEKSVAIIGAGPAGLVAARKLMTLTPFKFTIFERAPRVGGLWDRLSFINPEMITNFCRFTATFSDFAWESVDFRRPTPVYPQAWMVEKYLQEYGKLIPEECYEFETSVTRAEREDGRWKVVAVKDGEERTRRFDYLIVATGYLSTPKELKCEMDLSLRTNPLFPVPILHSTSYRKLEQILPQAGRSNKNPRTILIIGGSHSGSDISGLIAHQASDARWAPQGNESFPGVKVIHVAQHVVLPVPGTVRDKTSEHVSFYPLEFTLAERSTRPPEPLKFAFGPARFQEKHGLTYYYKEIIEGGVGDFDFEDDLPPFAIISDRYYTHVQTGVVQPMTGVVKRLEKGKDPHTISAIVKGRDGQETIVDNIAAVINATGFNSSGGLNFLANDMKEQLEFDPTNTRLPLVLDASYMAQHSQVPDIALPAFVPVTWGIVEMQCRAIANKWAGRPFDEDPEDVAALGAHIRNIRDAIKDEKRRGEVPQFLFGDYLGFMEQAARELGLKKINGMYGDFDGFICSSRYVGPGEARGEALKTMFTVQHLQKEIHVKNRLLAHVVFSGLLGQWTTESHEDGVPKTVHEINAHPRYTTAAGYDLEYVIVVKKTPEAAREDDILIARYTEVTDEITLWAVDEKEKLKTGDFVCAVKFDRDEDGTLRATAGSADLGVSFTYHLDFRGSRLNGFSVTRKVEGVPDESFAFRRPNQEGVAREAIVESDQKEFSEDRKLDVQKNGNGNKSVNGVVLE